MFATLIEKLIRREDLTSEDAAAAMGEIMGGRASDAQIGGFLVALAAKGERPAELVGLARTMRAHALQLSRVHDDVFDCCGTGGDRAGTFNISSTAAIVVAACGVRVAKHGNRSVSSACGSADVFEALGVRVTASPETVERCLAEAGIAFFFAPTFHPSMKHAGPARRALGVRTAFNLLGPLTNPAGARRQLVGVPRPEHTALIAHVLLQLGSDHAWVVHGSDGIDEISTTGPTQVSEVRGGQVRTFSVHPGDFGIPASTLGALAGGDAQANASIIQRVLAGEDGPPRNVVLLNAGAALYVAGKASSVEVGIERAARAVDAGHARRVLERLVAWSANEAIAGA
jgi:anthranilate phosphoribosyltransferase